MADYYPLLARALEALPDRSPALRRAVYDRARNALIGQLRSLEPPLPETAIDLEREALDAAIAKLEAVYGSPAPAPAPTPSAPPTAAEPPRLPPAVEAPPKAAQETVSAPVPAPAPEPPAVAPEPIDLGSPPPPAPDSPEALPEPGPPVDFVPFTVPPRKSKPKSDVTPDMPAEAEAEPAALKPDTEAGESSVETAPASTEASNGRQRPRIDVKAPRAERSRLLRNLLVAAILAIVIGLIAVAAYFLRDKPSELVRGGEPSESIGPVPESKLSDRVGGERPPEPPRSPPPAAGAAPEVSVAQRALIIEENLADPKAVPPTKQGRVVWRLESINGEQGQPLQSGVRADVEYPEIGFSLAMTIRKNLESTLGSSHTVELTFASKDADGKRVVQDVGLLQAKDDERARGAPVSGLPMRVIENVFLIGLSNLPNEIERNTELLRNREWFDIAIQYKNGSRAILAFEKGPAGRRVIESAFEQWRQ